MMSKKQWFVLLCLFIIYLLLGASLFFAIERGEEEKRHIKDKEERQRIKGVIEEFTHNNINASNLFHELSEYCGKPVGANMDKQEDPLKWDYYHSLFFVITVVSTIGYGNLAPTTMFTRIFMIFYGLIGIPLNGIVMVTLGDFFGKSFTKLYRRWKLSKMQDDAARLGLIGQIILYLVPGFTFFIFLPSVFMTVFEGWEYDVAVYYSFVTLTTIGFGDIVAGVEDVNNFGYFWHTIYKVFLLVWIIGGLGYVIMVLGFISQGLRSKQLKQFEHKIAENIKRTPKKLRLEFRALLREFFDIIKHEKEELYNYNLSQPLRRSNSCPDLDLDRNMNSPTMIRKRAFSECCYNLIQPTSETDLRIDHNFRLSNAFLQQQNLVLKVVDALAASSESVSSEEGGINCFSDKEILASEQYGSNWSIDNKNSIVKRKTTRAVSDVRLPSILKDSTLNWNNGEASDFPMRNRTFSEPTNSMKRPNQSILQKLKNKFKPKADIPEIDIEKQDVKDRKRSVFTINPEQYIRQTARGRGSILSTQEAESVLEHTSIAQFLRAMEAIAFKEASQNVEDTLKRKSVIDTTPQRTRRMPIRNYNQTRRSSLMPSSTMSEIIGRRLSLRPVAEHTPPPYTPNNTTNSRNSFRIPQRRKYSPSSLLPIPSIAVTNPVQRQISKKEKNDN